MEQNYQTMTLEKTAENNKVGYTNITFFYKSFKKIHGVTPAGYRKNNSESPILL
jgi:YesN/AraC family two-component response regulator